MKVEKSMEVQGIVITIFLQFILLAGQRFHGEEQRNVQYLGSTQTFPNTIPDDDTIDSELQNIFRNKYLNNGTRKYKKNRSGHLLQKTLMESKEGSTDPISKTEERVASTMPLCLMNANISNLEFPFCWNETNSNSYQVKKPKFGTHAGPSYTWNFNNINYNFYFPQSNSSSLQQMIKDIGRNGKDRKEDIKNLTHPPKNDVSFNVTNTNNILFRMAKPLNKLSKAYLRNSNETYKNNDIISVNHERDKVENKHSNSKLLSNELKQNSSSILMDTNDKIQITPSTHAYDIDEDTLLRDLKTSITQMHPKYFSVVSRQLSQKSKASLGRDTLSFVISPLWLVLTMIQLSTGARGSTLAEIERVTQFHHSNKHKLQAMRLLVSNFPKNTRQIRLFGYTRLTIDSKLKISVDFQKQAYSSIGMNVSSFNMDNIEVVTQELNRQVQADTENCMRRSFDVSDLEYERPRATLWNAAYLRAAWRASPTVLNASSTMHLVNGSTVQLRMYRLNDVMRVATVKEWNATVLEIRYKTRGLRQVIVMPHYPQNLLAMEDEMMKQRDLLGYLEPKFKETRVEVTLPKYTLEMTLLLPTKLKEMGMSSTVTPEANFDGIWSGAGGYVTHAVQHVKFWAEEGRGAFKDDGLIWDPIPDIKLKMDNPYFFLIRLEDVILMSGHFAI